MPRSSATPIQEGLIYYFIDVERQYILLITAI